MQYTFLFRYNFNWSYKIQKQIWDMLILPENLYPCIFRFRNSFSCGNSEWNCSQLFKINTINDIEIIRDIKRKRPGTNIIYGFAMRIEASNADETLIEKVVKGLIKQNTLINEKLQDLHSFKILKMSFTYHPIKLYLIHHQY